MSSRPHPRRLTRSAWAYAIRRALREYGADDGTYLAATLTHFSLLSLSPVLLAIFSIVSLVLDRNAETAFWLVAELTVQYVPADYQRLVSGLVRIITGSASGGAIALALALATGLWSSSGYVTAFSHCTNTIYDAVEGRGRLHRSGTILLLALAMLAGIALIVVSLVLTPALVTGLLGPVAGPLRLTEELDFLLTTFLPIWGWVKWLIVLVVLVSIVALLYHFSPNVRPRRFHWLSPGTVVAVLGIAGAALLLWTYLSRLAGYSLYGAVGVAIALVFALWLGNAMLLLGAEVDAEVERARQLQAGLEAESRIQLPPRSTATADKPDQVRSRLEERGRRLRLAHAEEESSEG